MIETLQLPAIPQDECCHPEIVQMPSESDGTIYGRCTKCGASDFPIFEPFSLGFGYDGEPNEMEQAVLDYGARVERERIADYIDRLGGALHDVNPSASLIVTGLAGVIRRNEIDPAQPQNVACTSPRPPAKNGT